MFRRLLVNSGLYRFQLRGDCSNVRKTVFFFVFSFGERKIIPCCRFASGHTEGNVLCNFFWTRIINKAYDFDLTGPMLCLSSLLFIM